MDIKKILVTTDFSPLGYTALKYATSLAKDSGAKLLITHVEEPPLAYGTGEMYLGPAAEVESEEVSKLLEAVVPPDESVPYEHHLLSGEPAREICALAESESADLIVMSTHGRTGLSRLLMGSVAESVVRHAPCPVFTLRQPKEEKPQE